MRAIGVATAKVYSASKAPTGILSNCSPERSLKILRVESNGVEQHNGIEVGQREQITGARVVIGSGAVDVDARGRFVIERLFTGDYELMIGPMSVEVTGDAGGKTMSRMPTAKPFYLARSLAYDALLLLLRRDWSATNTKLGYLSDFFARRRRDGGIVAGPVVAPVV
jgi:hypothetical protein